MNPKRTFPWAPAMSMMAGVFVLSACSLPTPAAREVLQISANGQYTLQGQSVGREQLQDTLAQDRRRASTLLVELRPSPHAEMATVLYAVHAVESAHARLAFADGTDRL